MKPGTRIAMLSYNTFLGTCQNGWVDGRLFLVQNDNGLVWGAPQLGTESDEDSLTVLGIQEVKGQVGSHWQQLAEHLPTLDKVVIYVGDRGSEHTIEYAAKHGLDPEKAMFVFCDCNMSAKEAAIIRHGFACSRRISCECGGHGTMKRMADNFLATGEI